MVSAAENLCGTFAPSALWGSLVEGLKWLEHATKVISASCNSTRCTLSEAEEVLAKSQVFLFSGNISNQFCTWIFLYLPY